MTDEVGLADTLGEGLRLLLVRRGQRVEPGERGVHGVAQRERVVVGDGILHPLVTPEKVVFPSGGLACLDAGRGGPHVQLPQHGACIGVGEPERGLLVFRALTGRFGFAARCVQPAEFQRGRRADRLELVPRLAELFGEDVRTLLLEHFDVRGPRLVLDGCDAGRLLLEQAGQFGAAGLEPGEFRLAFLDDPVAFGDDGFAFGAELLEPGKFRLALLDDVVPFGDEAVVLGAEFLDLGIELRLEAVGLRRAVEREQAGYVRGHAQDDHDERGDLDRAVDAREPRRGPCAVLVRRGSLGLLEGLACSPVPQQPLHRPVRPFSFLAFVAHRSSPRYSSTVIYPWFSILNTVFSGFFTNTCRAAGPAFLPGPTAGRKPPLRRGLGIVTDACRVNAISKPSVHSRTPFDLRHFARSV